MTFPATDMRFSDGSLGFIAKCLYLYAPHERGGEGAPDSGTQTHMLTCVCQTDFGYGTGGAQVTRPGLTGGFEQAAFFCVAPAKVIAIEMRTIPAGGGLHG